MNPLAQMAHQARFEFKLFWRNPASVFFSVGLPLVFLFLLGAVFGGGDDTDSTYGLSADQYLVPAIMTLGIVSVAFMNVAMTVTYQRERGILKRMRGTPLPTGIFIAARACVAVLNALLIAFVILAAGKLAYGIDIDLARIVGTVVITVIGAVAFCAMGFALTVVIPNEDAAPAVTNMIALPLYFVSGVFGQVDQLPTLLADVGRVFPISHLAACLFELFSPHADGPFSFAAKDIGVVLAWGVGALVVAAWKFRWEPQRTS